MATLGERAVQLLECAGIEEASGVQFTFEDGTTLTLISSDGPAAQRTDVPVAAKVVTSAEAGSVTR